MGFTIEYDGDDTDILDFAVQLAAKGNWVAQVTLRGDITSVADYVLSDHRNGHVTLTLWDMEYDAETKRPDLSSGQPVVHDNGFTDVQTVPVRDIVELRLY